MQTELGLECVLADKSSIAAEAECLAISKDSPVVAYFNCTRSKIDPNHTIVTPQPADNAKFALVYACQAG